MYQDSVAAGHPEGGWELFANLVNRSTVSASSRPNLLRTPGTYARRGLFGSYVDTYRRGQWPGEPVLVAFSQRRRLSERLRDTFEGNIPAGVHGKWDAFRDHLRDADSACVALPKLETPKTVSRLDDLRSSHLHLPLVLLTRQATGVASLLSHLQIDELVWADSLEQTLLPST